MKIEFKQDELINKNGKSYPVVGGRLRVAYEQNEHIGISTEMIRFESGVEAVVKAEIKTDRAISQAYGVASLAKDDRLSDSLLELAETRAIARALRFAGYGVEYTGSEEIPAHEPQHEKIRQPISIELQGEPATRPQLHAIEKIATIKNWNTLECCRRILRRADIVDIHELTKDQASEVIGRMKEAA